MQSSAQKILFITSSRIGDAVLSTGLLNHIHRTYPNAKITIVCGPLAVSLFEGGPNVDDIIPLKKEKHNKHWLKLWKRLATHKFDIVVDLRNSIVSRVIFARQRYIYGGYVDKSTHKVEQNAQVMKLSSAPAPHLWFTDEQVDMAKKIISSEGGFVLGVGPTANWRGKTWPYENFVELIQHLTAKGGIFENARVAVFGAPGEEDDARKVLQTIPESKTIDVIAKTDPGTAAACLAQCDFYIGNDSGLMHCAAAVGTPTVGLFGPSYPHIYAPWGQHTDYARTSKTFDELIDFEGYDSKTTGSLMADLHVEEVVNVVETLFRKLS